MGEISFDEQQLSIENAKLREEVDHILGIAVKYAGKPLPSPVTCLNTLSSSTLDLGSGGELKSIADSPNIQEFDGHGRGQKIDCAHVCRIPRIQST